MMEQVNKNSKKYKILILDDDDFLINMYALKFNNSNFEVDTAKSASIAFEKLKDPGEFDGLLVDVVLPEMNGFEFVDKVKKEKLAPKTAIIMLTNQSQPEDISRGKELKVEGYIVKASSVPSEVVSKVRFILDEFKK